MKQTQLNAVASISNDEFTAVPNSPIKLQHNGVGEVILTIGGSQYRMKEYGAKLHIQAYQVELTAYGATTGIVIK